MSQDDYDYDRTYGERWGGDGHRPDDFGPAMTGRHRRVSFTKALGGVFNIAFSALMIVLLALGGLAVYASSQIQREPVEGLVSGGPTLNVLVVGSDSRDGFTPEQLLELGTEAVDGRRTDTIFLLSIDGGRAAMLSFPRDLFVEQCDGVQGRVNAAFARGGPSCLVQTVSNASGIPIDHYVEVNLFGFVQIVDAVGGVPVFLDEPLQDQFAAVDLPAGCHVLDGTQAIGFVRARHVDSDLGRIARQQRFLRSLAQQVVSPSTLVNVPRLFRVAGSAGRTLIADEGLGLIELAQLARAARGLAGSGLATYTVPANAANIGGAAVLVPDPDAAGALYASFADGSVLSLNPGEDVQALQPGDVPVRVLNATGTEGLAATVRDFLTARGFDIVGIGNADPTDGTVVRYAGPNVAAAQLVAEQIPGATLQQDDSLTEVVLIVGSAIDVSAPPPPPMTEDPGAAEEVPVGAAAVPDECS
ncbi:Cell envelope-associated transcriptional attenuator LytR-CpsA-Psr, subfamily A1 [Euzebya pacifica]|uniref:Cell envelope-associated transcriptional attenuator LytR-CpsA-Psr, subfamily A1 n=1 Tax=Euzebya pacifica TaxID=1608957 RepID=A0A346XZY6_9ACTN|nr:LCP family protein [Euzebya pacifica]AXV07783.1 Cell envelope-associated transcriptional attenuator LytR-CpsA-Psr, subfamily A1 [Euzebya pacifica]